MCWRLLSNTVSFCFFYLVIRYAADSCTTFAGSLGYRFDIICASSICPGLERHWQLALIIAHLNLFYIFTIEIQ